MAHDVTTDTVCTTVITHLGHALNNAHELPHCKLKIPVTSDVIIIDIIYIVGFITVHIHVYSKTSFESHTHLKLCIMM